MRRIYESEALSRDREESFVPGERDEAYDPQSFRSVDASAWSDRLLPHSLRRRAVSLRVSTPRTEFERGADVPFAVTMKNRLPIPVTIETATPVLWQWSVDGVPEASHVLRRDPPERSGKFHFGRGERKRFRRDWSQLFRVSEREWEDASTGEHTIGASVNVANDPGTLADETTVRIVP